MTLIKDVTVGDGEEVPPNTRFVKTWKIQNPGKIVYRLWVSLVLIDLPLNLIQGENNGLWDAVFVSWEELK